MRFVKRLLQVIVYLFAMWGAISATFVGMFEYQIHQQHVYQEQQKKIWGH